MGNMYGELGVPHLTYTSFGRNPVHAGGVLRFGFALLWIGLQIPLAYLGYHLLIHSRSQQSAKYRRAVLIALPVAFLLPVILSWGYEGSSRELETLFTCGPVAPIALILWLYVEDFVQSVALRRGLQALIAIASVIMIFFEAFWGFPADAGRERARQILRGDAYFPAVLVVTEEPLLMSNQVETYHAPDHPWAYRAQYIAVPDTGKRVPSLQYVGADEDTVYLFDIGAAFIHAVPKESVLELIFYISSQEAWTVPDVEIPNYWATPVPTTATPSTQP